MDPDANLKEQREIAQKIIDVLDGKLAIYKDDDETNRYLVGQAERLAELVQSLDDWITNRGFLPREWTEGYAD